MLYQAYQLQSDLTSPWRLMAQHLSSSLWLQDTERSVLRKMSAACDVLSRMRLTHTRPAYGIDQVLSAGRSWGIEEETVLSLPFGALLHFKKVGDTAAPQQPPVLLAAPLSGHFATLLRETVRTLLQDHDVYITDWHNARDVSLSHGPFGLDDYIDHMIRFTETIGAGVHVVAVCQPCVAALAATAIMAEDDNPAQPRSLTLMAGPVDCRVNPTEVNRLAVSQPIDWFEKNLISTVPLPHAGFMRKVYPGFVQVSAFMSMNPERHKQAFIDMYHHLVDGDIDKATAIQNFYEEYLAVNDLPAAFYIETVDQVFQRQTLATGVFLTYLVPASLLFIPLFKMFAVFNEWTGIELINRWWVLLVVYPTLTVPFATWIMIGYFASIPKELDEAALIDGAGHMQMLLKKMGLPIPGKTA